MMSTTRKKRPVPVADGPPTLEIAGVAATIRLCRPSAHNRIDPDDIPVIRAHLDNVAQRSDVRVLVLTGGRRSCASD